MSASGHWDGRLVDVTGVTALLTLDLDAAGTDLQGSFSIGLLREVGESGDAQGQLQTGPVVGTVGEDGARIELRYRLSVGGQTVAVSVDGRLAVAYPHAKQAILGCFEIHEGANTLTLQGGGVVLWQYEDVEIESIGGGG